MPLSLLDIVNDIGLTHLNFSTKNKSVKNAQKKYLISNVWKSRKNMYVILKIQLSELLFSETFYTFKMYLLLQIVRYHAENFSLHSKYCD